jgi:hypothetical protein
MLRGRALQIFCSLLYRRAMVVFCQNIVMCVLALRDSRCSTSCSVKKVLLIHIMILESCSAEQRRPESAESVDSERQSLTRDCYICQTRRSMAPLFRLPDQTLPCATVSVARFSSAKSIASDRLLEKCRLCGRVRVQTASVVVSVFRPPLLVGRYAEIGTA